MKHNVGNADRIFRIVAGLTIIASGVYMQSWWGAVGIIPLTTAAFRFCPAYIPFGLTTCKTDPTP